MASIVIKGNWRVSSNDVVYHTRDKEFYLLHEYWDDSSVVLGAQPFTISNNTEGIKKSTVHNYFNDDVEEQLIYVGEYNELFTFWKECAINAMQGFQESGGKVGIAADFLQKETARLSFKMADAMLREYMERLVQEKS